MPTKTPLEGDPRIESEGDDFNFVHTLTPALSRLREREGPA